MGVRPAGHDPQGPVQAEGQLAGAMQAAGGVDAGDAPVEQAARRQGHAPVDQHGAEYPSHDRVVHARHPGVQSGEQFDVGLGFGGDRQGGLRLARGDQVRGQLASMHQDAGR